MGIVLLVRQRSRSWPRATPPLSTKLRLRRAWETMESRCTPWGPPPFVPGPEEAACCLGGRGEVYPVPHLQDARGTGKERVKLASGTLFLPPHSKPGELPGPQCGPNLLLWGAAWSGPWGEGGRDSGGSVMMESGKGSPDPQAGVTGLQRG